MCAHELTEPRSVASRIEGLLTWLGAGHWRELDERHERSTHAVAGAVVVVGAALAWLVASLAVSESARLPMPAIVALTLVFGLLVGAVTRATASGPRRRWPGTAGRAAVAVAVGVVVGELAALVMFSSSIEHRLDQRALSTADSAPAVAKASASLRQSRDARLALDNAVQQARESQDKALVVARCEYNPTPACPQTRITGVPGAGPETRTANELLADAQHELDNALAARDRQAPELDAQVARDEQALAAARQSVVADAARGLGARWVAMNELTFASTGALVLRLLTIALFALLYLLPLILRLWRGETTHDRHATARADRERAELEADTAIAIKRAEVRRQAEIMWAEHQLTQARLAIEAQIEIDREQQRRRVVEALEGPVHASSERTFEPVEEDMYLPIAAEAEAASRAAAELPARPEHARAGAQHATPDNVPAQIEPSHDIEPHTERGTPLIPSIPDATRAAARWIRPLVPPFVSRVIDNTTAPLHTARQVFEDVEEIAFSFKRTRKITVDTESSAITEQPPAASAPAEAPARSSRIPSSRGERDRTYQGTDDHLGADEQYSSLEGVPPKDLAGLSLGPDKRPSHRELIGRDRPHELPSPEGPRQLPPAE
jgi:Domain of unknown function (DUF4407)